MPKTLLALSVAFAINAADAAGAAGATAIEHDDPDPAGRRPTVQDLAAQRVDLTDAGHMDAARWRDRRAQAGQAGLGQPDAAMLAEGHQRGTDVSGARGHALAARNRTVERDPLVGDEAELTAQPLDGCSDPGQ